MNFKSMYEQNCDRILQKAYMFGLAWIGDGATIKRMPLMNMLVLCGEKVSVVVSVCNFTDHMVDEKRCGIHWKFFQ